jgi:hypothetical protein
MRITDNGGFRNVGMRYQSGFDFGGSHSVTGHVDNVIHTAGNLIITVFIPSASVTGGVNAGELNKVSIKKLLSLKLMQWENSYCLMIKPW